MRRCSLPQVVIPVPCSADWNAMVRLEKDGRARFCERCDKPVYDSKSMTRGELYDLIARHEGALPCLQLHRRPDGTIVTKDCFEPILRAGRAVWLKVGMIALAFWSWALAFRPLARLVRESFAVSRSTESILDRRETHVMRGMGEIQLGVIAPRRGARPPRLPVDIPPAQQDPKMGLRALLPEVDRAAPLRHLQVEEDLWTPAERKLRE